jgi:hypothetical protein
MGGVPGGFVHRAAWCRYYRLMASRQGAVILGLAYANPDQRRIRAAAHNPVWCPRSASIPA